MIALSQAQIDILNGMAPGFVAVLMRIDLSTGSLRLSSLPFDWTDPEGVTWLGSAGIVSFGEAFERQGLEGGALTLVWNAADADLMTAARDPDILGAPFTRQIVTIDDDAQRVGSALVDFVGECEWPEISPDPANPRISISVENVLVKLRRRHGYRYSRENHQRFFADDTFFDFVATLGDKDIFDDGPASARAPRGDGSDR